MIEARHRHRRHRQSTNTQFLYNDLPVKLNKWGDIEINGKTSQTSEDNIFAGGDCVTGPATVIQAVGAGRRAAEAMDSFLTKGYVKEAEIDYSCSRGSMEDLPKWEFERLPKFARATMPSLPLEEREENLKRWSSALGGNGAKRGPPLLKVRLYRALYLRSAQGGPAHNIEFKTPLHERPYIPLWTITPLSCGITTSVFPAGGVSRACAEIEGPDVLSF